MNKLNGRITANATLRGTMTRGAGGGTYVEANPEGEATDTLEKLMVEDTVYNIRNVPDSTSAHNGDVLTKIASGVAWLPQDKELPTYTSGDNGKVLKIVNGSPTWIENTEYSISEKVVGVWLDGSKVCQRVFTGLNVQTNGTNWVHVPSIDTSTWGEVINCSIYRTVRNKIALLPIAEVSPRIDNINDLAFTLVSSAFNSVVTTLIVTYTKVGD